MTTPSNSSAWKRGAAAAAGLALVGTALAIQGGPSGINASSHREAPLIAGDPRADNTDVYAFVSPDDDSTVTLIANWIPFEEPNGGPNFYPWADDTQYNIKIDNDGDAVPDLTYTWIFETVTKDPGQFLVNTGPFSSVDDDTLNVYQTYDLIVKANVPNDADESNDVATTLKSDVISAPSISGAVSTPDYQSLVDEAVADGTIGDLKSFAGQADDPFFLDLRVFDLLYGANVVPEVGEDTLAGYNVNAIALQVPKETLALAGDAANNPVIGIWSTTDRRSVRAANGTGDDTSDFVQVSRLGNPLVNEVVLPLALKDAFNAIPPTFDADLSQADPALSDEAVQAVINPILPGLIEAIYGQPAPEGDRNDLVEIFLQGVSVANTGLAATDENPALAADLNSLALNADVTDIRPSEMLRLNMAVPLATAANQSDLGVIGGDFQGFPNGRRLGDDVVDAALAVVEGIVFKDGADVSALAPFDSVDRNDREFLSTFPYVALPHLDSVTNGTERTPRAPEVIGVTPERLLETRVSEGQIGYTGAKPSAGQTIELQVAGVGTANIPSDASAVYLNVTSTDTDEDGYITVFPCGGDEPEASNLNPNATRTANGLVPAIMDEDGKVCLFTSSSTDIIVDVSAFHPSTAAYQPIVPERILETRASEGQIGYTGAQPTDEQETVVQVTGVGDANLPIGTKSVLVNITSDRTVEGGWVQAYSCDAEPAVASNVNTTVGQVRSNLASVEVAADGTICLLNQRATDLVVDLVGAAPASSSFVPVAPERVFETRAAEGQVNYSGAKPIAGQTLEVKVAGTSSVPADAGTVYLNVTGVDNDAPGYVTVFPCGENPPNASTINVETVVTAGMVAAEVGEGGRVCIFVQQDTHIVADLMGFFPGTILAD